ncbi:MAG: hypothetical protein CL760_11435 [Chloroflexi bacterium]|nr:hypothetical protein [Chloroflexota bacterium]|tara:strand:+ start:10910 stop:11341 length:432 start_codon:yes stop_codon:yes gene_type:complete
MKLEELINQFGKKLFDVCEGKHCKAELPYPENENLIISILALELLDDIPEYWQSFPAPTIKNREVSITLHDPRVLGSHNFPKTICSTEAIISPEGKFVERNVIFSSDYPEPKDRHKVYQLEEQILKHAHYLLSEGLFEFKKSS